MDNYDDYNYHSDFDEDFDFDDEYIERMNRENEAAEKARVEAQKAASHRLDELASAIKSWDMQDAHELCDYLNEFENVCKDENIFGFSSGGTPDIEAELSARGVDLCNLPCANVELDGDETGIYAVDVDKYVVYPTQQGWQAEVFDPYTNYLRK